MPNVIKKYLHYLDTVSPEQLEKDLIELGIEECPNECSEIEEFKFDNFNSFVFIHGYYEFKEIKLKIDPEFQINVPIFTEKQTPYVAKKQTSYTFTKVRSKSTIGDAA